MTLQLSMYSTYRPIEQRLMGHVGAKRSRRRFDLAGGVWREVPRKRMRIRKLALLAATCLAAYALFFSHDIVHVPVVLAPVVAKEVPVYIESTAKVQANQTVTVHTQMDGQLSEILFKEGQDVKAGEVLARLDPKTVKMQYDEAVANKVQDEAMLAKAKSDLAKLKSLSRKQAPAKGKVAEPKELTRKLEQKRDEVRQFEATIQSDDVAIDTLSTQLGRTVLVSPIDGRTGIRQVDAGNMVHTSDPNGLVVITQLEPITVVFDLPEKNLRLISDRLYRKEAIKALAMDVENKNVLDVGTLELLDSQVNAVTGTIHLKASFPNRKRVLWPGGTVHVRLLVSSLKDAVVVPASAVHQTEPKEGAADVSLTDKESWVFVYDAQNQTVDKRIVKVRMNQDGDAVIEQGLKTGESVVINSQGLLADGSYVTTQVAATR